MGIFIKLNRLNAILQRFQLPMTQQISKRLNHAAPQVSQRKDYHVQQLLVITLQFLEDKMIFTPID